jgi:hypothetical protein
MKRIRNTARRRLGIAGRPAIILAPNESEEITDERLEKIQQNKTVAKWFDAGVLEIIDGEEAPAPKRIKPQKPTVIPAVKGRKPDERKEEPLPEGLTGEGVELQRNGGWFQVYVNGFKVTDRNVRKDEAERIASEYE